MNCKPFLAGKRYENLAQLKQAVAETTIAPEPKQEAPLKTALNTNPETAYVISLNRPTINADGSLDLFVKNLVVVDKPEEAVDKANRMYTSQIQSVSGNSKLLELNAITNKRNKGFYITQVNRVDLDLMNDNGDKITIKKENFVSQQMLPDQKKTGEIIQYKPEIDLEAEASTLAQLEIPKSKLAKLKDNINQTILLDGLNPSDLEHLNSVLAAVIIDLTKNKTKVTVNTNEIFTIFFNKLAEQQERFKKLIGKKVPVNLDAIRTNLINLYNSSEQVANIGSVEQFLSFLGDTASLKDVNYIDGFNLIEATNNEDQYFVSAHDIITEGTKKVNQVGELKNGAVIAVSKQTNKDKSYYQNNAKDLEVFEKSLNSVFTKALQTDYAKYNFDPNIIIKLRKHSPVQAALYEKRLSALSHGLDLNSKTLPERFQHYVNTMNFTKGMEASTKIQKIEEAYQKLQLVLNNKETVRYQLSNRLAVMQGIKIEETMFLRAARLDEEQDLELLDQEFNLLNNWSISSIQLNPKNSLGVKLKLLFSQIVKVNDEGKPYTGFTGYHQYLPFLTVYNDLRADLTDKLLNYEDFIILLREIAGTVPSKSYYKQVVTLLENSDESIKRAFVRGMTSRSIDSETVLVSKKMIEGEEGMEAVYVVHHSSDNTSKRTQAVQSQWIHNFRVNLNKLAVVKSPKDYVQHISNYFKAIKNLDKFYDNYRQFLYDLVTERSNNKMLVIESKTNIEYIYKALIQTGLTRSMLLDYIRNSQYADILNLTTNGYIDKASNKIALDGILNSDFSLTSYDNILYKQTLSFFQDAGIAFNEDTQKALANEYVGGIKFYQLFSNKDKSNPINYFEADIEAALSQDVDLYGSSLWFNSSFIRRLASIESKYSTVHTATVFINTEGKNIYAQSMNNLLSRQITRIKSLTKHTYTTFETFADNIYVPREVKNVAYTSAYLTELLNSKENIGKPIQNWTNTNRALLHSPIIQSLLTIDKNGVVKTLHSDNPEYDGSIIVDENSELLMDLMLVNEGGIKNTEEDGRGDTFDKIGEKHLEIANISMIFSSQGSLTDSRAKLKTYKSSQPFFTMGEDTNIFKIKGLPMFLPNLNNKVDAAKVNFNLLKESYTILNPDLKEANVLTSETMEQVYNHIVYPEIERMLHHQDVGVSKYDKGAKRFLLFPFLNLITKTTDAGETVFINGLINPNLSKYTENESSRSKLQNLIYEEIENYLKSEVKKTITFWDSINIYPNIDQSVYQLILDTYPSFNIKAALAYSYVIANHINMANITHLIVNDLSSFYVHDENPIVASQKTAANISKRFNMFRAPGADSDYLKNETVLTVLANDYTGYQDKDNPNNNIPATPYYNYALSLLSHENSQYKDSADYLGTIYRDLETTNAQEYVTFREYIYNMYIDSKMNYDLFLTVDSFVFDELKKGNHSYYKSLIQHLDRLGLLSSFYQFVFNIQKPVHAGPEVFNTTNNKTIVHVYDKVASIALHPGFTTGNDIDKLRIALEKLEVKGNGRAKLTYPSGMKLVFTSNPVTIYNPDGTIIDNLEFSLPEKRATNESINNEVSASTNVYSSLTESFNYNVAELRVAAKDCAGCISFNHKNTSAAWGENLNKSRKERTPFRYQASDTIMILPDADPATVQQYLLELDMAIIDSKVSQFKLMKPLKGDLTVHKKLYEFFIDNGYNEQEVNNYYILFNGAAKTAVTGEVVKVAWSDIPMILTDNKNAVDISSTEGKFNFGPIATPFDNNPALIKINNSLEAQEAFAAWLWGIKYTNVEQDRRDWVIANIMKLKDKVLIDTVNENYSHGKVIFDYLKEQATLNPQLYLPTRVDYNTEIKENGLAENTGHYVRALSRKNYSIQQENPIHDHQFKVVASQQWKTKGANIRNVPGFVFEGNTYTGAELLAVEEELKRSKIEIETNRLVRNLFDESGNLNHAELVNIIQEYMNITPGYSTIDKQLVGLNKYGRLDTSIGFVPGSMKLQSIVNSIVRERITKQEVNGSTAFLVTGQGIWLNEEMRGKEFREMMKQYEGELIPVSSHFGQPLQFQKIMISDGIEATSEDFEKEGNYVEPTGIICSSELYTNDGRKISLKDYLDEDGILDLSKIDPTAFDYWLTRIPTQGHSSGTAIKIIAFLPDYIKNTIIVPPSLCAASGADQDGDKAYIMQPVIEIRNGRLQPVALLTDTNSTADERYRQFLKDEGINYTDEFLTASSVIKRQYLTLEEQATNESRYNAASTRSKEVFKSLPEVLQDNFKDMESYLDSNEITGVQKTFYYLLFAKESLAELDKMATGYKEIVTVKDAKGKNNEVTVEIPKAKTQSDLESLIETYNSMLLIRGFTIDSIKEVSDFVTEKAFNEETALGRIIMKEPKKSVRTGLALMSYLGSLSDVNYEDFVSKPFNQQNSEERHLQILNNRLVNINRSIWLNPAVRVQSQVVAPLLYGALQYKNSKGKEKGISQFVKEANAFFTNSDNDKYYSLLSIRVQSKMYLNAMDANVNRGKKSLTYVFATGAQGRGMSFQDKIGGKVKNIAIKLGNKIGTPVSSEDCVGGKGKKTDYITGVMGATFDESKFKYLETVNSKTPLFAFEDALLISGFKEEVHLYTAQPILVDYARIEVDKKGPFATDVDTIQLLDELYPTPEIGTEPLGVIKYLRYQQEIHQIGTDEFKFLLTFRNSIFRKYKSGMLIVERHTDGNIDNLDSLTSSILTNGKEVKKQDVKRLKLYNKILAKANATKAPGEIYILEELIKAKTSLEATIAYNKIQKALYEQFKYISKFGDEIAYLSTIANTDAKGPGSNYIESKLKLQKVTELYSRTLIKNGYRIIGDYYIVKPTGIGPIKYLNSGATVLNSESDIADMLDVTRAELDRISFKYDLKQEGILYIIPRTSNGFSSMYGLNTLNNIWSQAFGMHTETIDYLLGTLMDVTNIDSNESNSVKTLSTEYLNIHEALRKFAYSFPLAGFLGDNDLRQLRYNLLMDYIVDNDSIVSKNKFIEAQEMLQKVVDNRRVLVTTIMHGGQTGADLEVGGYVGKALGLNVIGVGTVKNHGIHKEAATYGVVPYERVTLTEEEKTIIEENMAEKGTDAQKKYLKRTMLNVLRADFTVIFGGVNRQEDPGSYFTMEFCKKMGKPFLVNPDANQLREALINNKVDKLNIAGNRAKTKSRGLSESSISYYRTVLEKALSNERLTDELEVTKIDELRKQQGARFQEGVFDALIQEEDERTRYNTSFATIVTEAKEMFGLKHAFIHQATFPLGKKNGIQFMERPSVIGVFSSTKDLSSEAGLIESLTAMLTSKDADKIIGYVTPTYSLQAKYPGRVFTKSIKNDDSEPYTLKDLATEWIQLQFLANSNKAFDIVKYIPPYIYSLLGTKDFLKALDNEDTASVVLRSSHVSLNHADVPPFVTQYLQHNPTKASVNKPEEYMGQRISIAENWITGELDAFSLTKASRFILSQDGLDDLAEIKYVRGIKKALVNLPVFINIKGDDGNNHLFMLQNNENGTYYRIPLYGNSHISEYDSNGALYYDSVISVNNQNCFPESYLSELFNRQRPYNPTNLTEITDVNQFFTEYDVKNEKGRTSIGQISNLLEKIISSEATDDFQKTLAKAFKDNAQTHLKGVKYKFVSRESEEYLKYKRKFKGNIEGLYDPNTDTFIMTDGVLYQDFEDNVAEFYMASTIVHELTHAYTQRIIKAYRTGKLDTFTDNQKEALNVAINRLEALRTLYLSMSEYKNAAQRLLDGKTLSKSERLSYAIGSSLEEFIAYMSTERIRKAIEKGIAPLLEDASLMSDTVFMNALQLLQDTGILDVSSGEAIVNYNKYLEDIMTLARLSVKVKQNMTGDLFPSYVTTMTSDIQRQAVLTNAWNSIFVSDQKPDIEVDNEPLINLLAGRIRGQKESIHTYQAQYNQETDDDVKTRIAFRIKSIRAEIQRLKVFQKRVLNSLSYPALEEAFLEDVKTLNFILALGAEASVDQLRNAHKITKFWLDNSVFKQLQNYDPDARAEFEQGLKHEFSEEINGIFYKQGDYKEFQGNVIFHGINYFQGEMKSFSDKLSALNAYYIQQNFSESTGTYVVNGEQIDINTLTEDERLELLQSTKLEQLLAYDQDISKPTSFMWDISTNRNLVVQNLNYQYTRLLAKASSDARDDLNNLDNIVKELKDSLSGTGLKLQEVYDLLRETVTLDGVEYKTKNIIHSVKSSWYTAKKDAIDAFKSSYVSYTDKANKDLKAFFDKEAIIINPIIFEEEPFPTDSLTNEDTFLTLGDSYVMGTLINKTNKDKIAAERDKIIALLYKHHPTQAAEMLTQAKELLHDFKIQFEATKQFYLAKVQMGDMTLQEANTAIAKWYVGNTPYAIGKNEFAFKYYEEGAEYPNKRIVNTFRFAVVVPKGEHVNTDVAKMKTDNPTLFKFYQNTLELLTKFRKFLPEEHSYGILENTIPFFTGEMLENMEDGPIKGTIKNWWTAFVTDFMTTKAHYETTVDADEKYLNSAFYKTNQNEIDAEYKLLLAEWIAANFEDIDNEPGKAPTEKEELEMRTKAMDIVANRMSWDLGSVLKAMIINAHVFRQKVTMQEMVKLVQDSLNMVREPVFSEIGNKRFFTTKRNSNIVQTREVTESYINTKTQLETFVNNFFGINTEAKAMTSVKTLSREEKRKKDRIDEVLKVVRDYKKLHGSIEVNQLSSPTQAFWLEEDLEKMKVQLGRNFDWYKILNAPLVYARFLFIGYPVLSPIFNVGQGYAMNYSKANQYGTVPELMAGYELAVKGLAYSFTSKKSKLRVMMDKYDLWLESVYETHTQRQVNLIKKLPAGLRPFEGMRRTEYFNTAPLAYMTLFTNKIKRRDGTEGNLWEAHNDDGTWNDTLYYEQEYYEKELMDWNAEMIKTRNVHAGDYTDIGRVKAADYPGYAMLALFKRWWPAVAKSIIGPAHKDLARHMIDIGGLRATGYYLFEENTTGKDVLKKAGLILVELSRQLVIGEALRRTGRLKFIKDNKLSKILSYDIKDKTLLPEEFTNAVKGFISNLSLILWLLIIRATLKLMSGDDDDDKILLNLGINSALKLYTDLKLIAGDPWGNSDLWLKTVPVLGLIKELNDVLDLIVEDTFTEKEFSDIYRSGVFKGRNKLGKEILDVIPGLNNINRIDRMISKQPKPR